MRKFSVYVVIFLQFLLASVVYSQFEPTSEELEFSEVWTKSISEGSPEEDVLLAAMLSLRDDRREALDYLSVPMKSIQNKKIRLSFLAVYCLVQESVLEICEDNDFDRQLQTIDADNIQPYLYSMVKQRKDDDALASLRRANNTTSTNDYLFDKINFAREKLASIGYPKDRINYAAENLTGVLSLYGFYLKVHSVCKEKSVVNESWKQNCLLLGRRLESYTNKNAYQYSFSFAIITDSLGKAPEEEKEREAVLKRKIAFGKLRDLASEKFEWWSNRALTSDEYYKDINELGEVQAIRKAVEESE
ncbi:hypothetical protein NBRC116493_13380 [Aurantivibrio infirmus]